MPDQIPDIYKAAIKRYEDITHKRLDDPSITRLTTLGGLKDEIDARNKEFTTFREKRHGIFAVLSAAMRPIELLRDLAAGGASMAFPPSSLVFGAVSFLINAAKDVSARYDAIVELMDTLKMLDSYSIDADCCVQDFTVRLEVYSREQISKPLSDKLADIFATLVDIFALSRKEIKGGRFQSFAKNALIGKSSKIDDAVAKLAKLTESEDRLVGAETLTEVKQSGRTLDGVSMTVNSTSIAVTQMSGDVSQVGIAVSQLHQRFDDFVVAAHESAAETKESKGRSHQERTKAVLQPSESALDWYDKINKSRVADTCNWVREEPLFQSWINKEMPVLWITGNPGAGKSYVASNIISFFREQYPQGVHHTSNVSVSYFFFKDDNPETRSFNQALRDIAYQISQNDPAYAKYVALTCDSAKELRSLQSIWRTLFANYFLKNDNVESCVYLVLDGMDESYADSREEFLTLTKDLREASDSRMQIVMLGRPQLIEEFEMAADMAQVPTIYITALNNSNDIMAYIGSSIKKSASLKRAPKSLQAEIVEKLSSGAQGMFIWVDFMLKELMNKKWNEGAIRTALKTAPRGLNEMIRHVLEGFSSSLKGNTDAAEELNTLLAWVTCAQRPLTLKELDTLLKVISSTGSGNFWLEGTLRIQFASFFSLIREDGLTTADLQRIGAPQNSFETVSDDEIPTTGFDDVENDTSFDSDPATTEVTFCHASIGDFFRNDPTIHAVAGEDCPAIGLNYHEAKVSVLKTCMEVLSSDTTSDIWLRAATLLPYMQTFWISALHAVDLAEISKADKIFIGKAIIKLLSDDQILVNVVGHIQLSQFSQENVDLFAKWVTDSDVFNAIPQDSQDWVLSTSQNRAELFLPCIKYIGEQWLHGVDWHATACALIIYAYIGLCAKDFSLGLTQSLITSEMITKTAEWCGFEQDALWHRRLAMALRKWGECDAAIPHFQKALELDSSMWQARDGEALCYVENGTTEDYKTAVELDKMTINELEKMRPDATLTETERKKNLHECLERLAATLDKLDELDEALKTYEKAFSISNRCDHCICTLLERYHDAKRYEDIMKLFRGLNEPIEGLDYTRLSESLLEGSYKLGDGHFKIFAQAAFATDELPFAFEMYHNAITAARRLHQSVQAAYLELCLATLYDRYGHDSERAVKIWGKILDTYRSIKAETKIAGAKRSASISLARYCVKRSVEVGKDSNEAEGCGTILQRLSKVRTGSQVTIAASASTTMLGAWYKLMGRDEEANACFRVQVKESIRMLSDDDPTNDKEAYRNLAMVLAAAGDDKTAIGLVWEDYGFIKNNSSEEDNSESNDKVMGTQEQVERAKIENYVGVEAKDDTVDSTAVDDRLWLDAFCDGCFRYSSNSFAKCRYCHVVDFCQDCFTLLKASELKVNVCSPKHSWLIMESRSKKELKAKEPGSLWIDGQNVTIDELKKRLAAQWKI